MSWFRLVYLGAMSEVITLPFWEANEVAPKQWAFTTFTGSQAHGKAGLVECRCGKFPVGFGIMGAKLSGTLVGGGCIS